MSRVWVDLVFRGAGQQTSLFSIRPPEVLQRSSLEDSSTNCAAMPPSRPALADAEQLSSASEAVPALHSDLATLWNPRSVLQGRSGFMSLIGYVCPGMRTNNDLTAKCDNR